ncbi:hypothetical protein LR48_Vigan10g111800 [Vigna angularis]|uniref:Uncharacterized protein n=1 Tax=Phaseolus angularis TaxID=3914 RepID=A0A0L9VJK2_PHAAN|nr:hypothetical protein LR48_Vigan10g111800 [Vigna angularis]
MQKVVSKENIVDSFLRNLCLKLGTGRVRRTPLNAVARGGNARYDSDSINARGNDDSNNNDSARGNDDNTRGDEKYYYIEGDFGVEEGKFWKFLENGLRRGN